MIDGTPHVMIFPNLFIAEIQMFVIQPLGVNDSVQHVTALNSRARRISTAMRQQTMGSVGPAGFLLADDSEMYERTQRGIEAHDTDWVFLGRANIANGATRTGSGRACDGRSAVARHLAALPCIDGAAVMIATLADSDLMHDVEQFLFREARLADEHRYENGKTVDGRRHILGSGQWRRHRS